MRWIFSNLILLQAQVRRSTVQNVAYAKNDVKLHNTVIILLKEKNKLFEENHNKYAKQSIRVPAKLKGIQHHQKHRQHHLY